MHLDTLLPLWAGQSLIGWLIADLVSGFFHWCEDRLWRLDMPILGEAVVRPNRLHHVAPLKFTLSNAWSRGAVTWVATLIIGVIWALTLGVSLTLFTAVLGGLLVNEVHCWAHRPELAPAWLRPLQEAGLIQSPKHHVGHHKAPGDRRYCILTNWLNPMLDSLHVWEGLEAAMTRIGLEPNRGTA